MRGSTHDRLQALQRKQLPQFATELNAWVDAYKINTRQLYLTQRDLAGQMKVHERVLSSWLNGKSVPKTIAQCRAIAGVLNVQEDLVLEMAGHPSMSNLLTTVEPLRHNWDDGKAIYKALQLTREVRWKLSRSYWRTRAEEHLEDRWDDDMTEPQLHQLAREIADFIYVWSIDPQRDVTYAQRQIA